MVLIALGGLPYDWHVFNTTIFNNKVIPDFDEILTRCTQEETRMIEYAFNGNGSDPTAFAAHAKKKNHGGLRNQNHGRAGPKGRKGRCYTRNKSGHYARECHNRRDSPRDDDNNNSRRNGRNNKFQGKRKAPSNRNGNGKPFKRSRNSKYDGSNVVDNKINEFILVSALSVASPPNTLDVWLIDSGASRHFTSYKEALFNLVVIWL